MNTDLIPVFVSVIDDSKVQTVDARILHKFLEVGRDFSNWIKARIEQGNFLENQDFMVIAKAGDNQLGGRPFKEYHISLRMAKHLAMLERNNKGQEAREYFIQCEEELFENKSSNQLITLNKMMIQMSAAITALTSELNNQKTQNLNILTQMSTLNSEVVNVKATMLAQKPKVEAYNQLMSSHNSIDMETVAKVISSKLVNGKTIGKNTILKHLRNGKILTKNNLPYQRYIDNGYFEIKINTYQCSNGQIAKYPQVLATSRGLIAINTALKSNNLI